MNITSDMIYGYTDGIILCCLSEGDSYGYEINSRILEKSGRSYELKEATLYTTFRRLEKQGYVTSYWGNESSGPRRRYYSITGAGREYLQKRLLEWEEIKKLLDRLLDGGRKEE
ncbi:PadR family transcriptional regulator [Lachnoclostridium sp. An14]|uniref:PadR family transcriptional regulator n=1 Tax=Lachnoclostridium sp. An14 TaxID=1965562 RepID=UPI000B398416|nr:PadR family transcriptional regulator [Lachnoclostridium sp. An14]OUQ16818.1 PadR family transcriptional regulator [Lachnoclostridium sp. An14]